MGRTPRSLILTLLLVACPARAQQPEPLDPPDLSEPVLKLLEADYLTDAERRDLRVFHGVWRESDLDSPARRAGAALARGAFDDPSLADPAAPVEDRAEAAMLRGEPEAAIAMLAAAESVRGVRIRAEALESLGRAAEAAGVVAPLVERMRTQRLASPADLTDGVRALMVRARVAGQETEGGNDFRAMMGLLARARDDLGRLYWPAYLAEAQLLYDKDNREEAGQAAMQALAMNPSCQEAWSLVGRLAVDSFNFDGAEQVAARLDKLAPGSPAAAEILARARLRQNDPDGAHEALAPALARYPAMRPLLALDAAASALDYRFDAVDAQLAAFDALSPGSPRGLFEVGRTLSEARQYEPAAKYLSQAAARSPFDAAPVIELGLLGLQSGRDADALDALRRAVKLDTFNVRAANSLKLVEELASYERVETPHFVIRYKRGTDGVLAAEMPDLLETMYDRVTGAGPGGIDHEPAERTTIELMPDHRAFAVRIAGVTQIHTMAASTGPVIAMESPREGPSAKVGAYDWLRVVRHEYTHTVTLSRTRNRIPHWFTEASAVNMEDSPRDYSTCQLLAGALGADALFDLEEISLAFVRPKKPTDRAQAYAQGCWMYQYIIERWGDRAPLDLMDRYAAGERQESAFLAVLGLTPDQFLEEFVGWARAQVVSWGMGRREGEPSIGELMLQQAADGDVGRRALQNELDSLVDAAGWSGATLGGRRAEWSPDLSRPDRATIDAWLATYPAHPGLLEEAVNAALAEDDGEPSAADIPLLERYAAARPVDPLPHKLLAKLYLGGAVPGPDAAIEHLEYLDAREQHSAAYAVELARRYAARKDWTSATLKARRAVTIAPFVATHRELAASIAVEQKDYRTARHQIEALIELEPGREVHQRRLEAVRRLAGE